MNQTDLLEGESSARGVVSDLELLRLLAVVLHRESVTGASLVRRELSEEAVISTYMAL